ncbi:hypothetical protein chiPu_0004332 [Chiloscyllium punctatum]|uniref:Uncharacterized protein n=1 Tax=Chiloscyllium punctatum TaxID=137246 RepID=A0A401S6B6_CHIPU|nr:hypothetical protein [Chiloscyllium punctatum]
MDNDFWEFFSATGTEPACSLMSQGTTKTYKLPIEHLDYSFVEKCTDVKYLEKVLISRAFYFRSGSPFYGKGQLSSFSCGSPYYFLKIPPKKRRRFTKSFGPLSHGRISVRVYNNYPEADSGGVPSPDLSILLHILRTPILKAL